MNEERTTGIVNDK